MPGPMRTQAAPGGGELERLAKSMGIDLSALGGGAAAGPDPNDPPVYFGTKTNSVLPRSSKFTPSNGRDGLPHQRDSRFTPNDSRSKGRAIDDVRSLSQANAAFYELEESELVSLQKRLFAAGILNPKKTALGDYDDDTYSAFSAINERAARFNAVGRKLTPNDVLNMVEKSALGAGFGQDAAGAAEPGNVSRTTNPLTIEQQVQQVARERLGRKLKASEVAKFAALYQGMEKSYNAQMNEAQEAVSAGADATIEEQAPVGAAADQFIDANYANEAGGQDAYGYLGALKNLLGG